VTDVSPDQIEFLPDFVSGGVSVEIVDSTGFGFRRFWTGRRRSTPRCGWSARRCV
jgi:hypothetical protein